MRDNPRYIATQILKNIEEKDAFSNIEIAKSVKNMENPLDEGMVREIVYGVLQNKIMIDYIISKFSKTKIKKLSKIVLQLLRTGIYQIVFMDRVPDSAACNEAVKIAKKKCHRAIPGFINGVLRNVVRNKENVLMQIDELEGLQKLHIKYSHPMWLVEFFAEQYGLEFAKKLCEANNTKPKLNIRVNTLKISKEQLVKKLEQHGLIVNDLPYAKDGLEVQNPRNITNISEFKNGLFSIQDESSMLVAEIMNPAEGSLTMDLCSAPGGKTCHVAQKMNNKGRVVARDIYEHKLLLIDKAAKRLDIDIIETQLYSALELDNNMISKADYCLVDAPCSGLGLLRRKPEIRYKMNIDNIKELSDMQLEILSNASKYVKKSGILVYSTCTINKIENIGVLEKFLSQNTEFELVGFDDELAKKLRLEDNKGYVQLSPNEHMTDGFFIAKMKKK